MKWFSYGFHILLAGIFGISLVSLGLTGVEGLYRLTVKANPVISSHQTAATLTAVTIAPEVKKGPKAIRIDLDQMSLTLYEGERVIATLPVLSKGRPGSPWETPTGRYQIELKEAKHFSSIGRVWMPHSLQFFGNFFIHGWPYYEGGALVDPGYSGGCVRLATTDAAQVFAFADLGTLVEVVSRGSHEATATRAISGYSFRNRNLLPKLTARAYLVADIETGEVILEDQSTVVLPIASITKLMTALVSLETIDQSKLVKVSERALATHGDSGQLKVGESLAVGTLIYPLLLESSNDAAEVIAESLGRSLFINQMNARAGSVNLHQTTFADPSGISAENVSTAKEIFQLTSYLYKHKSYLLKILREPQHAAPGHLWKNFLTFINDERYLGGKSGHTTAAGDTLTAIFSLPLEEFGSRKVAIVLLGSENRELDTEQLLNYLINYVYYGQEKPLATERNSSVLGLTAAAYSPPVTKLAFVGDLMLDRGVQRSVEKNYAGDFNKLFTHIDVLSQADILFGNLEGPASNQGKDLRNLYSFRMLPETLTALRTAGFEALAVANNHSGDWGREAFIDTLSRLDQAGIAAVGGGPDREKALAVKVIKKNGLRFGFLGASDVGPNWLAAGTSTAGIILAHDKEFLTAVERATSEVDFLTVSYHFGDEYQTTASTRQETLARAAIDAGAKAVIGHHPHVAQGFERYRDGLIAYSLGNFIFDQDFSQATMRGMALGLEVGPGAELLSAASREVTLDSHFVPSLATTTIAL